jgi:hypothetical protein
VLKFLRLFIPRKLIGYFKGYRPVKCKSADIAFHMRVFRDTDAALQSLPKLRHFFPDSRVFVIFDGVEVSDDFAEFCKKINIEVLGGERLYTFGTGGRLVHRMLEVYMQSPRKWLVKIDPDTVVHRHLSWMPRKLGIFGTYQQTVFLQGTYISSSIQGGFVGMTHETAQKLYDSQAFLNPELYNPEESYAKDRPRIIGYVRKRGISEDWIFGYVLSVSGMSCYNFEEVLCNWRVPVSNSKLKYAFTHPAVLKDEDL